MNLKPCLMGINPATKECTQLAINCKEHAESMRREGLICVPATKEIAYERFCEVIEDIYEVAQ